MGRRGDFVVTGAHDRSLRLWRRTNEPVFLEEEQERELEALFEERAAEDALGGQGANNPAAAALASQTGLDGAGAVAAGLAAVGGESGIAGQATAETLRAGERLMAALEAADTEAEAFCRHERACASATARWKERRAAVAARQAAAGDAGAAGGAGAHASSLALPLTDEDMAADAAGPTLPVPPKPNVALLGRTPSAHVLSALFAVKAHELETSLLVLPFRHVATLVSYVAGWFREPWLCAGDGREVELAARSLFFLLRTHERQLCANRSLRATLLELGSSVRRRLEDHRDRVGHVSQ